MSVELKENIKIKKLNSNATTPTKGSEKAAGYDLYACLKDNENSIAIFPHTTKLIGTGLAIQPPRDYFGMIVARSGIATKRGLRPANCVGVCDEDYRGEYMVAIHNDTDEIQYVEQGERIAQLIFMPYISLDFIEVKELDDTERGSGGFGSTGAK